MLLVLAASPCSGSLNSACIVAQAKSAWLASSLRLASYVGRLPLAVVARRIAIKDCAMSQKKMEILFAMMVILLKAFRTEVCLQLYLKMEY